MAASITFGSNDIIPTQLALIELGHRIQSFREPLDMSIREVAIPAISANFATQGHGTWPPLAQRTTEDKARMGAPNRMLVRTRKMITAATQVNSWEFGGGRDSATLSADRLPYYAGYHVTGTVKMPKRDFTEIGETEVNEIEGIFASYIQYRINRFHGVR